jgi:hypothetical protein
MHFHSEWRPWGCLMPPSSFPLRCVAFALGCLLVAGARSDAAAPPTAPADPDRFIIVGGRLVWCEWEEIAVGHIAPTSGSSKSLHTWLDLASQYSIQYHFAHDALWLVTRNDGFHFEQSASESMQRYPLEGIEAKARRDLRDPNAATSWEGPSFARRTAGGLTRWAARGSFPMQTHTDFMITGSYAVRQFVLQNHGGIFFPYGKGEFAYEGSEEIPFWTLKAYTYETGWDERAKAWKKARWRLEECLPVGFREPFQLLSRGDDYYFVTRSGKVYLCARPAKGKEREMKCIWSDKARKVVGLVTDARTGRSFLFCRALAGEQPRYFELAPKPRPVPYGEEAAEFPTYEPMIVTGRKYARALIADGKVKLPPKDEGKK